MKKGDELDLKILSLNSEGAGIAKTEEGLVVFIKNTLPGDIIRTKITRKKNNFAEGSLTDILTESPFRIKPQCDIFGVCGGCKIQNYQYDKQLEYKTEVTRDAFKKIGGFENIEIPGAIGCKETYFYRNKMEFSFSDDKWFMSKDEKTNDRFALGLHIPKFYSKIIDVEDCKLQSEISNGILNFTREFFKSRNASIYNTHTHTGYLRFLVIRQSRNTDDLMVNLITNSYDKKIAGEYAKELLNNFPSITTIVNSTTERKAQVAFSEKEYVLHGEGFIYEILSNNGRQYKFKISPNSFFQTNTSQTEILYKTGLEFLQPRSNDSVLDLYCGAGSISIFTSNLVKKVTGVEIIKDAIDNANENALINYVTNVNFIESDIKDFIKQLNLTNCEFNKVILDPPRAGLHPDICRILSETNFKKILYISCNPGTQARDLQIICSNNRYRIEKIQPVDMFPQTYHVENVCSLVGSG
ncbi:MAG: 23S rRNA (uracil(1939)-C(5))-methyltransferase RlmD [Ignavibacteria bacterium]|nr:23S rRNA (uracil(1939)-C(5))-methyltransferase RlmD [Ignavibacteria bacterium]